MAAVNSNLVKAYTTHFTPIAKKKLEMLMERNFVLVGSYDHRLFFKKNGMDGNIDMYGCVIWKGLTEMRFK